MAERATSDRVAADMKPPNYRGAVQRVRGIKAKKDRISGINGEIKGIYDTIEGFKVNKKAARIFATLDTLESEERSDIMRSLEGLIDAAEWDRGGDLVDSAEGGGGKIVTPNFRRNEPKDRAENDAGEDTAIDDAMRDIESEPSPPPKAGRLSPAEARERAQKHFGEGRAPPVSSQPDDAAPYTGDNTDLAGGDDDA